jgi:NAD+ kinase
MVELVVEIDGRPLSHWGCDGVVCATPTGSTAYAFSAGGPVVWPEVEALLVVPISAHALFARPLVVSPRSVVALEVLPERRADERGEAAAEPGTPAGAPGGAEGGASEKASATGGADAPRAVLWCDGRRKVRLPPGARVEVRRGAESVRLARLHQTPFTNRLVTKFGLPVSGWRGRARPHVAEDR